MQNCQGQMAGRGGARVGGRSGLVIEGAAAPPPAGAPPLPALIPSRYRLVGGAMPDARRGRGPAQDGATGEPVFLKWSEDAARIEQEAEILAMIDHPSVVKLIRHEASLAGGVLVLELIEGLPLERWLRARASPLEERRLQALLSALADALGTVHAAGFLHRDVKPGNIMMRGDGQPVLVDFDAAALLSAPPTRHSRLTDGFAAPEQYGEGQAEGPWTDVYGLAALGYRALIGLPPPPAPARLAGAALAPLPSLGDPGLALALTRGLALAPAERPADMAAWRSLLRPATQAPGRPAEPASAERLADAALDDYPPTVLVERRPAAEAALPLAAAASPPALAQPRRALRPGLGWLAVLLLLAGAAWLLGQPWYQRHLKTDWLVDPAGGGDAVSIGDALRRAGPGAVIRIAAGRYAESLAVSGKVRLVARDMSARPVVAPPAGQPCLTASGRGGEVLGLAFELAAPATGGPAACLVLDGDLRLEASRIQSRGRPAVWIRQGAAPVLRGNVIEDGQGILWTAGGRGELRDNDLRRIAGPSLTLRGGASPAIQTNRLQASGPILLMEGADSRIEGNLIAASLGPAIELQSGAVPAIVDNRIEQAGAAGIHARSPGAGRIEGNRIQGSRGAGVLVEAGGEVTLGDNLITENGGPGIRLAAGSRASLEGNQILRNRGHGIELAATSRASLGNNQLQDNQPPDLLDERPVAHGPGGPP